MIEPLEVQPVRQGVQPGERHVGRTDLQRQDVVGQAAEGEGPGEQVQHQAAVHGEQRVVLLEAEERAVGGGQLRPQHSAMSPGQEEHDERGHHVVHADQLVIGAGEPLEQARGPLVVLVLVLVGDRAIGENGHAAAFVVELDVDDGRRGGLGQALLRAQPGLELGGGQRHHVEEHQRVVEPAQLGALGPVDARCAATVRSNTLVTPGWA